MQNIHTGFFFFFFWQWDGNTGVTILDIIHPPDWRQGLALSIGPN
jgi:hypothetical protein